MYTQLSLYLCILFYYSLPPSDNTPIFFENQGETVEALAENQALVSYIGALIEIQTRAEKALKAHLKIKNAAHKDKASKGLRAIADSKRKLSAFRAKASKLQLSSKDYKALLGSANQEQNGITDIIDGIFDAIWDWWNDDPKDPTKPFEPEPDCNGAGSNVEYDCNEAKRILRNCDVGDITGVMGLGDCRGMGQMERMICMMTRNTSGAVYIPPVPDLAFEAARLCDDFAQIIFREQREKVTADGN